MQSRFSNAILVLACLPFSYPWSTSITFGVHFSSRTNLVTYSCTSVAPGFCCRNFYGRVPSNIPRQTGIRTSGSFTDLPLGAISAFWDLTSTALITGCNGHALDTRFDVPHWSYQVRDPVYVGGASYIECPVPALNPGWATALAGFCNSLQWRFPPRAETAEIPSSTSGVTWGYPNIVIFNNTKYTDDRRGDLIYRDSVGNLLDMSLLGWRWCCGVDGSAEGCDVYIGHWGTIRPFKVFIFLLKRGWHLRIIPVCPLVTDEMCLVLIYTRRARDCDQDWNPRKHIHVCIHSWRMIWVAFVHKAN